MYRFQRLYYASVKVLCVIAVATVVTVRVCHEAHILPHNSVVMHKTNYGTGDQKKFTLVKKQQRKLLYLPGVRVVGCSSLEDARKIAKVFADAGTDPIRGSMAYDTYWATNECRIYTDGVSLEPMLAQASFVTKQHAKVGVFKAEEGEVDVAAFKGTIFVVIMNPDIRDNIFRCEHNVNEESGFDSIELCRPNI